MPNDINFDGNEGAISIYNSKSQSRPSIIGKLIEIIASNSSTSLSLERVPSDTIEKVKFNNLVRNKWIIHNFTESSLLIEDSIVQLNQTILNGSTKLKRQMKLFYLTALGTFYIDTNPFDIEKLKSHSDDVVEEVIRLTKELVSSSADLKDGYFEEDIEIGVALITSYSIVECIVLENPNDYN